MLCNSVILLRGSLKKRTVIITSLISTIVLGGLVFAAICLSMKDFSSKVSYFQSAFEVETPYFSNFPDDQELKDLFNKNKESFHELAKMAQEDKLSSFRKSWIFHKDCSMVFFPYILGEFPSDKIISRERFFKYLTLMKECKIQDFGYECDDQLTDRPIESQNTNQVNQKPRGSRAIRFFIFQEYKYDNAPEGKFIQVDKHILYSQTDKNCEFVSNTDDLRTIDIQKSIARAAYVKLEPNWAIKKSISLQDEDPGEIDENEKASEPQ